MSVKIKNVFLLVLGVFVLLVVIALLSAPQAVDNQPAANKQNEQPAPVVQSNEPPPPPEFQSQERRFEVIGTAVAADTYRVREQGNQTETELFIPADATITAGRRDRIEAGTILTVQKFMEFANGIVAADLSISTRE